MNSQKKLKQKANVILEGHSLVERIDYGPVYIALKKKYDSSRTAIEVDFRDLVKFHSGVDRYTHLFHAYPAKLLLNIPYFFINCSSLNIRGGIVLDPFCGSGTVLLESILAGKDAIGADANPLARLITKAKTNPLSPQKLKQILDQILNSARRTRVMLDPQNFLDWQYWYSEKVRRQLGRLIFTIKQLPEDGYKAFFEGCFSACVKKVSLADPLVSVPVRLNPERYTNKKRIEIQAKIKKIESLNAFFKFLKTI